LRRSSFSFDDVDFRFDDDDNECRSDFLRLEDPSSSEECLDRFFDDDDDDSAILLLDFPLLLLPPSRSFDFEDRSLSLLDELDFLSSLDLLLLSSCL
jgi:hypothetical protein